MAKFSLNALGDSKACIYLIDTSQCCLAHMLSSVNKIRASFEPDFPNKPPGTYIE